MHAVIDYRPLPSVSVTDAHASEPDEIGRQAGDGKDAETRAPEETDRDAAS